MNAHKSEIVSGEEYFQSDSRLLLEFGERLVARMDIAITELIKNAYDADSLYCRVWLDRSNGDETLHVQDEGHGITLDEFRANWLRIATGQKSKQLFSRTYKRRMAGAKGIGRFAVRYLGKHLEMQSVAKDEKRGIKTLLTSNFDWTQFKSGVDLNKVPIPFRLETAEEQTPIGTHLLITNMNEEWTDDTFYHARTGVVKITSPLRGLDPGRFKKTTTSKDPGFEVLWSEPGIRDEDEKGQTGEILDHALAKVTIDLNGNKIKYSVQFKGDELPRTFKYTLERPLLNGLHADIRFFPRRAGVFADIPGIDGREAYRWIRDNCGIAIVDHGFRIPPFGDPNDDWLQLAIDVSTSRRAWRSFITEELMPSKNFSHFPEALQPALHLPHNTQVVGAVFLESHQGEADDQLSILIISMDRQGYVPNAAFEQLRDIVRPGLEFLAIEDLRHTVEATEARIKAEKIQFKREIREARAEIEQNPELPTRVRNRLVSHFKRLETGYAKIEEYHAKAKENLDMMATIGVVAGFVAHENQRLLQDLEQLQSQAIKLSEKHLDEEFGNIATLTGKHIYSLKDYLNYSRTFIKGIHSGKVDRFKAAAQVNFLIRRFGQYAKDRNIRIINEIDIKLDTAPTLAPAYSGVLLNLLTNAIKAILAGTSRGEMKIVFRAQNVPGWHIVRVMDTGVGIPDAIRDRIWDPLFSTTFEGTDPLASGMGLGLPIIKRVLGNLKGEISLVNPPEGFNTCFEVRFRDKESK